MRVLIDECVPRRIRGHLPGHDVHTVPEMGWSGKKDRELLALMSGQGFEVLVTVDRGVPHQQNLQAIGVAAIVLVAPSNRLADLVPLMPAVLVALGTIKLGDVIELSVRSCFISNVEKITKAVAQFAPEKIAQSRA